MNRMKKRSSLPLIACVSVVSTMLMPGAELFAQVDARVAGAADREIARRQADADWAAAAMLKGDQLMLEKDYEEALTQYKGAVDAIPDSVATEDIRNVALSKYSYAAVQLAEERVREGRYPDARILCEMVLAENYNPNYRPAQDLLKKLDDPQYFNQTMGPRFIASVEEVKTLLNEAQGFLDSGRYDLALKRTDQVLNLDPYNVAARRLQQDINKQRNDYGNEAYTEARGRMLWEVTKAWQSPVRRYGEAGGSIIDQGPQIQDTTARINRKINSIIIPSLNFRDATIREAIDFLKQKSAELDTSESDPSQRGVNIVLKLDDAGGEGAGVAPSNITLNLSNIPLSEALRYVAQQANLKVKVESFAVAIVPPTADVADLVTQRYRVSPSFIQSAPSADTGGSPFGGGAATAGRSGAKEFLEANGVEFPPGASAYYLASTSQLVVRNTQDNLELIEILVQASQTDMPTQVEIESKFIEITQNNLKELSFDWLLGQFNVAGSERVFAGGGTSGTAPGVEAMDYPFVPPGSSNPVGRYPLTAGNRSGSLAVSANAVDALLFPLQGQSQLAPGVLGLAGVFTDPQFQLVIRALNQKKGVDLLSSPRVMTKSGNKAVIEVVREFIYPEEYDAPQIPTDFGGTSGGGGTTINMQPQVFPVTPATPTSFVTKNIGVTLTVEPTVLSDKYTIEMHMQPEVIEFEGFINYGSPINTVAIGGGGLALPQSVTLTENRIEQPVFSRRAVDTYVSIWDGQTVALGGLIREDVQKVEDKVPLLGDIPFVGRAFRSNVDQHIKRNLIIFVTARQIDPAGQPLMDRTDDDEEVISPTIDENSFNLAPPQTPIYSK